MKVIFRFLALALVATVYLSVFIVDQREKAMVFRFGEAVRIYEDPGLKFKIPFIETVRTYNSRILPLDTAEFEVTFADNRRLTVDAFSRWRISDVRKYHVSVLGNESAARTRIASFMEDKLRRVLGNVSTDEVLSENRVELMRQVLDSVRFEANQIGVESVDVRIVRADLPESNLEATVDRMISEREEEAAFEIAQGREAAAQISANARRQEKEIVSGAQKDAEIIKGEADAERNQILAEAYNQDREFFDFYRSLQAYTEAMKGENTTLVISPDDDFFRFLNSDTGAKP